MPSSVLGAGDTWVLSSRFPGEGTHDKLPMEWVCLIHLCTLQASPSTEHSRSSINSNLYEQQDDIVSLAFGLAQKPLLNHSLSRYVMCDSE